MLTYERQCWAAGAVRVAGVDEAGRGPLAGPVVAGAVVFERDFAEREERGQLAGIDDSKKLSPARREFYFDLLTRLRSAQVSTGRAEVEEIDRLNILRATHLAMRRAIEGLAAPPDVALVDGRPVESLPCRSIAIVGGDGLSLSIAAASIVAKVTRDRLMAELDREYPRYGFAVHKGYGTHAHIQALFEHGPCPEHRATFLPVRDATAMHSRRAQQAALPTDAPAGRPATGRASAG